MALANISSQLHGIGEMSVQTLIAISDLDSKLVTLGSHFHALEVREETWSSMRDRLIELDDRLEDIEEQFDSFPIYSMYCLEILEEIAENNGIVKENFRTMEDKKIVNTFRRKVTSNNLKFTNNLSGLGLSDEYAYFCSLLEDYSDTSQTLDEYRNERSNLLESSKTAGIPDLENIGIDYLENLEKEIEKFEEIEAALPDKRKELNDKIIEERQQSAYYQKLVSSDIKVDMNSAHPLAKWYRENASEIMAEHHQKGFYPHEDEIEEICGSYRTVDTESLEYSWKRVKSRVRCSWKAINGQPYCQKHRLERPAWAGNFHPDPSPVIGGGSGYGHGWEMKSFTKTINKELSHWERIRKPLLRLDVEIAYPQTNLLRERKEIFIGNNNRMNNLTDNIESASIKLGEIENNLSKHLPVDIDVSML